MTHGKEVQEPLQLTPGKTTISVWRNEVEKLDNPFRYAGQYHDEETGYYYLRASYDLQIQRFISEDSFAKDPDWDDAVYAYGEYNPIRYTDPSGHFVWDIVDKAMAGMSWGEFAQNPTLANFGWAALDTVGVLPGIPSPAYVTRSFRIAAKAEKVITKTAQVANKTALVANKVVKAKKVADKAKDVKVVVLLLPMIAADGSTR